MDNNSQFRSLWGVILGGSSGFGLASVEKLASAGMNIATAYRETAAGERKLKNTFGALQEKHGIEIMARNINALEFEPRQLFVQELLEKAGPNKVKVLLHSIARGN